MDFLTVAVPGIDVQAMLRPSRRARALRVSVRAGGAVVVSVPPGCSLTATQRFLRRHAEWIAYTARKMAKITDVPRLKGPRHEYERLREAARRRAYVLVARFAVALDVQPKSVSIRNASSRWGSCSSGGTLSFHYRLAELPDRLAEYLVVHELCHLRHMDHSPAFWAAVGKVLPDCRVLKRELRSLYA